MQHPISVNTKRIGSENAVLKCFDGPAHIVRPGVKPPSSLPLKATLMIGTDVVIISLLVKNFDLDNIADSLTLLFFLILSSILIYFPFHEMHIQHHNHT